MRNPAVSGFHPDPSVCRVGDDYYLACSTFEYLPGVPIFHSRDMEHVELLTHVAVRDGQLGADKALTGGGAWAPTIRYHDEKFWLVIPDMMGGRGNVLFTADRPEGPWSDGIVMEVQGIDPDIAWDEDGTCYVTMSGFLLDEETGTLTHLGITQVTLDPETGKAAQRGPAAVVGHRRHVPRGSAPVPARRLVVPDDRRGRHRAGPLGHHRPLDLAHRSVRGLPPQPARHGPRHGPCRSRTPVTATSSSSRRLVGDGPAGHPPALRAPAPSPRWAARPS